MHESRGFYSAEPGGSSLAATLSIFSSLLSLLYTAQFSRTIWWLPPRESIHDEVHEGPLHKLLVITSGGIFTYADIIKGS